MQTVDGSGPMYHSMYQLRPTKTNAGRLSLAISSEIDLIGLIENHQAGIVVQAVAGSIPVAHPSYVSPYAGRRVGETS